MLVNEEKQERVRTRYITAAVGMSDTEFVRKKEQALALYGEVRDNIKMYDSIGQDMAWVERVAKTYRPDILVLDMGDKFATMKSNLRQDEILKKNVILAREIGKKYDCAVFYMSQLSAEAEGKTILNLSLIHI